MVIRSQSRIYLESTKLIRSPENQQQVNQNQKKKKKSDFNCKQKTNHQFFPFPRVSHGQLPDILHFTLRDKKKRLHKWPTHQRVFLCYWPSEIQLKCKIKKHLPNPSKLSCVYFGSITTGRGPHSAYVPDSLPMASCQVTI